MKLPLRRVSLVNCSMPLLGILFLMLLSSNSFAMWAGIPDAQLVKQSDLIIKARYIGATTLKLNKEQLHLGVLKVKDILKGSKREVVLIRNTPTPSGSARRSDEITFQTGQYGLWFLEKSTQHEGIYEIKHPQRFIPEQQFKNRLPALLKLLD